jgi:hypothetical protein
MTISLDPVSADTAAQSSSRNSVQNARPAHSAKNDADTSASPSSSSAPKPVALATQSPNVTFRRDAKGQIYYVLTDSESGKELREVPPATIRAVSEGIAEFLKSEEAQANAHLEVKA